MAAVIDVSIFPKNFFNLEVRGQGDSKESEETLPVLQ